MRTSSFETFLCCWFLVSPLSLQLELTNKKFTCWREVTGAKYLLMESCSPSSNCLHRNASMRTASGAYLMRWLNSFSYSATDKFLCFIFRNCFHLDSLYMSVTYFALNSWIKNSHVMGFGIPGLLSTNFHNHMPHLAMVRLHMMLSDREGF